MATKTPKQRIAETFGSRAKAVDAIAKLTGADKEERSRLMGTTNKKLLRIHEVAAQVQASFGGKSGLIDAIADKKFGDKMTIAMDQVDSKRWFGATPPDLTLVARVRRPDWLYTYLRSFYEDDSRPWGVHNVVFKDVGMPHVLAELQGNQVLGTALVEEGFDTLTGQPIMVEKEHVLYIEEEGTLSADEYDKLVYDLVNFMVYMAEPIAVERERLGWWVLLFLAIFFVPVYFLNKEFWRDIK